jgi:hypothetical protein
MPETKGLFDILQAHLPWHRARLTFATTVVTALLIGVPDLLRHFRKDRGKSLGAVANLQKGVKEAEDDGDVGKKRLPSSLSSEPAVGVDGLWLVIGVEFARLLLEVLVRCSESLLTG